MIVEIRWWDLTNQVFDEQENNGEEHDEEDLKFT